MKKRIVWMDVMRLACAFLVIVNHTNSAIFQSTSPSNGSWWLSLIWYYLSKPAVPLFVMISGACLLPRQEGYRRTLGRALRTAGALVLFSLLFYLYEGFASARGTLPYTRPTEGFLTRLWMGKCGDAYWYLYFYVGLMLMLPLLRRMYQAMSRTDALYLMGMSFGLSTVWPLAAHYVPQLALAPYAHLPVFSVWIGLFFAGAYLEGRGPVTRRQQAIAALCLVGSLAVSVGLTYLEYRAGVAKYWFMDDRMNPSAPTCIAAVSLAVLARGSLQRELSPRASRWLAAASGCSFGIYLLGEMVQYATARMVYVPLCNHLPAIVAVLLWECVIFCISFAIASLLKHIPGLKRLI